MISNLFTKQTTILLSRKNTSSEVAFLHPEYLPSYINMHCCCIFVLSFICITVSPHALEKYYRIELEFFKCFHLDTLTYQQSLLLLKRCLSSSSSFVCYLSILVCLVNLLFLFLFTKLLSFFCRDVDGCKPFIKLIMRRRIK